jgi:hypothetical protein|tara:strand:- start:106 stop:1023 length:918 start_codon:yes stop_codon:yes gene_type:complete
MGRVQLGRKQRVEVADYDDSTKAIARKIVRDIVEEGFNGADVLPGVWVIEKTLRNHIVAEQPNIAPDISSDEVEDLAQSILASIKTKTDVADEKVRSLENYEKSLNVPKELPTIKMGNISVVKFPEGGADAERSIKVKGFKKVGKFYRPQVAVGFGKRQKKANLQERIKEEFEKKETLRRIKIRKGLLKPVTTKTPLGRPLAIVRPITMPEPGRIGIAKNPDFIKMLPSVQKAINLAVSPVKREIPFLDKISPEEKAFLLEEERRDKKLNLSALERDDKFLQRAKTLFPQDRKMPVFGGFRRRNF